MKNIFKHIILGIALAGPFPAIAQTTPIDLIAPGPHLFYSAGNMNVTGSGGATPTVTFDIFQSASAAYVQHVNTAANTNNGLQAVDVCFDIDFGTGGTTAATLVSTNSGTIESAQISTLQSPTNVAGASPAGFESRFKYTFTRIASSSVITATATKVASVTVVFPASTLIAAPFHVTNNPTGSRLQLRHAGTGFGTGPQGSKWGDFVANLANTVGTAASQPLPLTVADFNARKTGDGQRSELLWTTTQEKNIASFDIERSVDAKNWEKKIVATVKAAGNSTAQLNYVRYDDAPHNGDNYYRLRITEISGEQYYGSQIRKVNFGDAVTIITVAPNPLSTSSTLLIDAAADGIVGYTISDAAGRTILSGNVTVRKGQNVEPLKGLQSLAVGTYYLNAISGPTNKVVKLTKLQ